MTLQKSISISFFFLTLALLSACNNNSDALNKATPDKLYHHSIFSFGTIIDVSIYGTTETEAELAFNQLEDDFGYMQRTWSPKFRNALLRDNQLISLQEWFSDAPSVRPLIQASIPLANASNHLFNPAVGKLIALWGFNNGEHDTGIPPDDDAILALVKAKPMISDIEIKGIQIKSNNADVNLNFGAIAKGYGIKREIDMLKSIGINNAIINAGGDLHAIGMNNNRPWRIGIKHPRGKNQVLAYVELQNDEAVFTSGDYERFFEYEGKRYHHIIDPRTGYPATGTQSVTVIHSDPTVADAAATALFIAGPKDWQQIAKNMGIKHVLLVDSKGKIHISPDMQKRVIFKQTPENMTISKPL